MRDQHHIGSYDRHLYTSYRFLPSFATFQTHHLRFEDWVRVNARPDWTITWAFTQGPKDAANHKLGFDSVDVRGDTKDGRYFRLSIGTTTNASQILLFWLSGLRTFSIGGSRWIILASAAIAQAREPKLPYFGAPEMKSVSTPRAELFVAKRNDGIDLRSLACGNVARQQRNNRKQGRDG